jgi:hypothetical protein
MADRKNNEPKIGITADYTNMQEREGTWLITLGALVEKNKIPEPEVEVGFTLNFQHIEQTAITGPNGYASLTIEFPEKPSKLRARVLPTGPPSPMVIIPSTQTQLQEEFFTAEALGSRGVYNILISVTQKKGGKPIVDRGFRVVDPSDFNGPIKGKTGKDGMPRKRPEVRFTEPEKVILVYVDGFDTPEQIPLEGPMPGEVPLPDVKKIANSAEVLTGFRFTRFFRGFKAGFIAAGNVAQINPSAESLNNCISGCGAQEKRFRADAAACDGEIQGMLDGVDGDYTKLSREDQLRFHQLNEKKHIAMKKAEDAASKKAHHASSHEALTHATKKEQS